MKLSLPFAHRMTGLVFLPDGREVSVSLNPVKQQFRRLKAQVESGWNIDHLPNGHHGDVIADTVSTDYITFPTTAVPSTGATTLDAYKEGSFTPTIGGSGGQSGQAYTTQIGRYVKVGQLVFVTIHVVLSTEGTITGTAQLQGLPFTSDTTTNAYQFLTVNWDALPTNFVSIIGRIDPNTTAVNLLGLTAAGQLNANSVTATEVDDNSVFMASGCYRASQ